MSSTQTKEKRTVLLLNASEEVISFVDWKRAICLLTSGKARKPYNYDSDYEIRTTVGVYKLPRTLVLVEYVRIPYRKIKLTRENVFRRDNYTCQYCGCDLNASNATLDHVKPVSRGGGEFWENLVSSCRKCNTRKGNRTLKEARMEPINKPRVPSCDKFMMTFIDEQTREVWGRWLI